MLIEKAREQIDRKKEDNKQIYGKPYISYEPGSLKFETGDSTGYSDKVLRIPSACFLTAEFCQSDGHMFELGTYTPCEYPPLLKTTAFSGSHEDDELHRHDYFEMVYVIKGKRTMLIENQEITFHENEICIFDMHCAHLDLRSCSEGIAFYCGFTSQQTDAFFISNLKGKKIQSFFLSKNSGTEGVKYLSLRLPEKYMEEFLSLFDGIAMELEQKKLGNQRVTQVYLLRALNLLGSDREAEVQVHEKKIKGTKLYQAVARYISDHISDISIEKLCSEFHYQEDYYNRLIRKNTGLTFSQYIRQMRLDRSKNLLINTDMSVKAIMDYLGYTSHAYFYRVFQEETGLSPMQYRKEHRQ